MTWSSRRQLIILAIVLSVVIIVGGFILWPYIFKAPTCNDGLQNQGEVGIDCGGQCTKLCSVQVNNLKVLWSRTFKVANGVYDALSYVENQNFDAALKKVVYTFILYDTNNILVAKRVGKTYITPNGKIPIFEGAIRTGERVPKRATIEFDEIPEWTKVSQKAVSLTLSARDIKFETIDSHPTVFASIANGSIYNLSDIEVTVILYDDRDNAFAVSRTIIDSLNKSSSGRVVFTWVTPFEKPPKRIEIIPRVNIFSINF